MKRTLQKLKLILWKNYIIRKRHYVVLFFEIFIPVVLFFLVAIVRSKESAVTADNKVVINTTTYYPIYSGSEIVSEFSGENRIFYSPINPFTDSLIAKIREKCHISEDRIKKFNSENELLNYFNEQTLKNPSEVENVFAIIMNNVDKATEPPKRFNYKIRTVDPGWRTSLLFPIFILPGPMDSHAKYFRTGFLALQYAINTAYLELLNLGGSSDAKLPINMTMQEFPYPPYTQDFNFMEIYNIILPIITLFSFVMLCPSLLKRIVEEKFTGVKELMKMMGLKSWMLWFSWLIHALVVNLVSVTIIVILLKVPLETGSKSVIPMSNEFLIWTFFVLYCTASICFCFALSTLFNKPTIAMSASVLIWILSYFIPNAMVGDTPLTSRSVNLLLCLIPNMAMSRGYKSIATFEGRDVGLQWSNLFDSASGLSSDVTMGCVFVMFIIDIIFYLVITWYIDSVKPGVYGLAKPWYFPVMYCFNSKVQDSNNMSNTEQKNCEPPPVGIEAGIQVRNLRKMFGNKIAVDGLNIDFYKGQITALLGHNGAGKTTTVSILTGMFSPTSGSVSVDGHDIQTQIEKVRDSLGLCPQHNMLFIDLTVMEHLVFFAMLKGSTKKEAENDACNLLNQFNLSEKKNKMTETLSGGMKRKLALGIAIIGKSKVLMLDEPTSGMDPEARREIWDILLRMRMDRTIIITTHFMEEADVLGDRIAIMDHGQLQCYGTSLYLKKLYGAGYQLSLMKTSNCSIDNLTSLIKSYVEGALLKNVSGAFVNYALPTTKSSDFPKLFQAIENQKEELGINSIGVSITTLEEVFLRVGKLAEEYKDDKEHKDDDNFDMSETASDAGSVEAMRKNKCEGWRLTYRRFIALFNKRKIFTYRRWILFTLQSIIPILMLLLVISLSKDSNNSSPLEEPELNLDLSIYGRTQVLYSGDANTRRIADFYGKLSPTSDFMDVSDKNLTDALLEKGRENIAHYRLGLIVAGDFHTESDKSQMANAMFSSIALHAAPISLNMLTNAILKAYKGADYSITISNHPLDRTTYEINHEITKTTIISLWYILVPLGLLFLIGSFITYPLSERVCNAKQLQLMTGVTVPNYWLACFAWDFVQYILIASIMFLSLIIFDYNGMFGKLHESIIFVLLIILYGVSGIPYAYVFSYFKKTIAGGFALLLILNMFLGIVLPLIVMVMEFGDSFYQKLGTGINYVAMLIPHYGICYSMLVFSNQTVENARCANMPDSLREFSCGFSGPNLEPCCSLCNGSTPCTERFPYFTGEHSLMHPVLMLFVDMFIYIALILFFMETSYPSQAYDWLLNNIYGKKNNQNELDDDVKKEKDRVDGVIRGDSADILLVQNLEKRYKGKFAAVRGITFGVHRGECFGLLGVNGAGKTTTFKMLTGVELPTEGDASIEGICLNTKKKMFLSQLGYCPQFDAFNESLTGKEMLEVFARIRGIREEYVAYEVRKWLNILGLREYKDVISGTYSGGNKRKLSTALALIGDPPLVLLDEPTSGVDPMARRNLWDVLTNVQKSGQSIVLTSHSMDECEALCNRLAIMVSGQLVCLGETQYLKQRYGQGYTVMLKLSNTATQENINSLRTYFERKYECELKDQHQGLLHYHIKNVGLSWFELFNNLEDIKHNHSSIIEDYTISETTLEEVFLSFARTQQDNSEDAVNNTHGDYSIQLYELT